MNQQKLNQQELEILYSRRNLRKIVREFVEEESDSVLLDWYLKASLAIQEYLDAGAPYQSRNDRIQVLKETWTAADLAIEVATSVLSSGIGLKEGDPTYQQVAGHLAAVLNHEDTFDRVRTAAELLAVCEVFPGPIRAGLYDIKLARGRNSHTLTVNHQLDPERTGWVNELEAALPLIEPPRKVRTNKECGYHVIPEPILTGGRLKQHDQPVSYDVVNLLNAVEWELDHEVMEEKMVMPEGMDIKTKTAVAKAFVFITDIIMAQGNSLWWAHQFDTRGRIYQSSWPLNFQGFEWMRAAVNFKQKEILT